MIDLSDFSVSAVEQVAMMEGILIAAATGGSPDNSVYEHLRREFMADPSIRELLRKTDNRWSRPKPRDNRA